MTIRLLALDLDGTLVDDLMTINLQTSTAIEAVLKRGVYVTLATGREYRIVVKFAKKLGINAPIICYQGGLVRDFETGEILLGRFIPADISRQVIKFARHNKLPMLLYTLNTPYAELASPLMRDIFTRAKSPYKLTNNLLNVLTPKHLPLKFLFVQAPKQADQTAELLRAEFGDTMTIVRSHHSLIEATLPTVSKGTALEHLARHLQIPLSQTMAIGDQDNDIAMLKVAGLGVAMGNASAGAKEAADVIAPSINEDGAVWAMERYILGD